MKKDSTDSRNVLIPYLPDGEVDLDRLRRQAPLLGPEASEVVLALADEMEKLRKKADALKELPKVIGNVLKKYKDPHDY